MSSVLEIDALADSPLADLHALASELGVEDYRLKRKPDLAVAILVTRGADESAVRPEIEAKFAAIEQQRAQRLAELEAAEEQAEQERREAEEKRREQQRSQRARGEGQGGRGGRQQRQRGESRGESRGGGEQRSGAKTGDGRRGEGARERGGRGRERERGSDKGRGEKPAEKPAAKPAETFAVTGVFESRQGGGGMLRAELGVRSPADVEVGRAEVRKFRLYKGDQVSGTAKKARRAKGAGLLDMVQTINGLAPDQAKSERVRFDDAPTQQPSRQLAKKLFKAAPFGCGSRALVVGPARGAASQMLTQLAEQLGKENIHTTLAVVAAPPEGTPQAGGPGYEVVKGSLTANASEFTTGLQLAVERGKRVAEAGGDAVVVVDGIDLMPAPEAREVFNSARNLATHGSLTIVGSAAPGGELEALAGTTAVIADGRRLKLDKKKSWSSFK
jgi:transcription termination factor Rho